MRQLALAILFGAFCGFIVAATCGCVAEGNWRIEGKGYVQPRPLPSGPGVAFEPSHP